MMKLLKICPRLQELLLLNSVTIEYYFIIIVYLENISANMQLYSLSSVFIKNMIIAQWQFFCLSVLWYRDKIITLFAGSGQIQNLGFRDQWYMVGQKGIKGFTPYEVLTSRKARSVGSPTASLCIPKKSMSHKKNISLRGLTFNMYSYITNIYQTEILLFSLLCHGLFCFSQLKGSSYSQIRLRPIIQLEQSFVFKGQNLPTSAQVRCNAGVSHQLCWLRLLFICCMPEIDLLDVFQEYLKGGRLGCTI